MEPEEVVAELRSRIDDLETQMRQQVLVLEHRVSDLDGRFSAIERSTAPQPQTQPSPYVQPPYVQPQPQTQSPQHAPPPRVQPQPQTQPPPPAPYAPPPNVPTRYPAPAESMASRPPRVPAYQLSVEAVLRWAGLALVVLSAVFLVSTAISRGWIGPELQLLGATAIGLALLGSAIKISGSHRGYASALGNGGAVVVIVCAGAAYSWLDLYSPTVALCLVGAAAGVSVLAAARLRMEAVAITSAVTMLIVPTLAEIVADGPVLTTGIWLGLFAIFATGVGIAHQWAIYRVVSTWATALWVLGLAALLAGDGDGDHALAGTVLVAVVGITLWISPLLADRFSGARAVEYRALQHRPAVLLPLWAWTSALLFFGSDFDDPGGWIGLLMAAGFVLLAAVAGPLERWLSDEAFASHLLGAGLLVTVSMVAWLGGSVLLIVLAGQAVATLALARILPDVWLKINAYLLAGIAWLMLAGRLADWADLVQPAIEENLSNGTALLLLAAFAWLVGRMENAAIAEPVRGLAWVAGLGFICSVLAPWIDERDWLVVGVVLTVGSLFAAKRLGLYVLGIGAAIGLGTVIGAAASIVDALEFGTDVSGHLANLFVVAALGAGAYVMWVIEEQMEVARPLLVVAWIGLLGWLASVLISVPQGQVALSISWAIAACLALVAGVRTNETVVRVLGLGTLAAVLGKMLTVDLAEVDTLWRVGLFMVIGLGLLRLGYVLPAMARRFGPEAGPSPVGPPHSGPSPTGSAHSGPFSPPGPAVEPEPEAAG